MVCASALGSYKVPSGSRKMGTGIGIKAGWLGNGTGVVSNAIRLLLGKRALLAVWLEAVEGGQQRRQCCRHCSPAR